MVKEEGRNEGRIHRPQHPKCCLAKRFILRRGSMMGVQHTFIGHKLPLVIFLPTLTLIGSTFAKPERLGFLCCLDMFPFSSLLMMTYPLTRFFPMLFTERITVFLACCQKSLHNVHKLGNELQL